MRIYLSCPCAPVPQQLLYVPYIQTTLMQMRGITVSQTMNTDILLNARLMKRLLEHIVNTLNRIPAPRLTFKKILRRMKTINILIQLLPYFFRYGNYPVYPPFPFPDMQDTPVAVQSIGYLSPPTFLTRRNI